jgi:hypothetical protein
MNTGLQDGHNLAFKLADVLQGRRKDTWLDRYEAERRPVAQRLVSTTDQLFRLVTSSRMSLRVLRRLTVPLIAPVAVRVLPRASRASRVFAYVGQLRIHYWMTPGAKAAAKGRRDPVIGRRLPWTGDNYDALRSLTWQIHAYGGITASDLPELDLPVHLFPAAPDAGLHPGRLYLIRPDGFVAAEAALSDAPDTFRRAMI